MINDSTEPMQLEAETVITTFQHYGAAWGFYIGLTVLLAALIWFSFRKQHFLLKWFLTSIVLVGALCFSHPAENIETYSPLILNTMVELFDGNNAQFMSDMKFIAMVWGIVFMIGLFAWLMIRYIRKDKTPNPQNKKSSNTNKKAVKEAQQTDKEKPMATEGNPDKRGNPAHGATPVEPTIGDDI